MTTPLFDVSSFAGHQGEIFQVTSEVPRAQLEVSLMSVTPWGPTVAEGERQPFSLLLHGPLEPLLPQHIYRFDHPSLGTFDIFIVPVGPDRGGMRYEAVFT